MCSARQRAMASFGMDMLVPSRWLHDIDGKKIESLLLIRSFLLGICTRCLIYLTVFYLMSSFFYCCWSIHRLGLAKTLMDYFENVSVNNSAFFVDLFVRASNSLAIQMYEKFGYVTHRRVLGYYSGELPEDALDMRKALPRYVFHY
jgi:hypothetical protein